jgi:adenylate cyclase
MLNIHFSAMTDVIFAHHGTIDKFIGDAIMAFWGAPVRNDAHALLAVRAALEMMRVLPEVNAKIVTRGLPPIDVGIGINTGEAVLGNIGSEKKLAYTAIGDNVNLASRLEGLTKTYGCPVLISENTCSRVRDHIPCRIVDMVRVKGKTLPIRIYSPLPVTSDVERAGASALCDTAAQAFDRYQRRQWTEALALYESMPPDRVGEIFIERCRDNLRLPPPDAWDGTHTLTSK